MKGLLMLRVVLLVLAALLAAALIARGDVLIGVLIGAMAVVRALMFAGMHRRRRDFAKRFPGGVQQLRAERHARWERRDVA
jgi:hypothetical protein